MRTISRTISIRSSGVRMRSVMRRLQAQPLVDLVAADLAQVVAAEVEEQELSSARALSAFGGSPGRSRR